MKTLAILGREHTLSFAELEKKTGSARQYGKLAIIQSDAELNINTYGGTVKFAEVLAELSLDTAEQKIQKALLDILSEYAKTVDTKFSFGLSIYGHKVLGPAQLQRLGLTLKKQLKQQSLSSRFVQPKKGLDLTAAQLKFNKLTTSGCELIVARTKSVIFIARTYGYQDIDSYTKRDRERPVRDSKVGMLPPKLAQIMINLGNIPKNRVVYDPFCGNGVILQEAMLAGHKAYGSDLEQRMVNATEKNLEWLRQAYGAQPSYELWQQDATKLTRIPPKSVIVTEGYLGTPLHYVAGAAKLREVSTPVNSLYLSFLSSLRNLLTAGQTSVIAFPVWQTNTGLYHLPVVDQIGELGYTLEQCSGNNTLIYRRENQLVGREIAILVAK